MSIDLEAVRRDTPGCAKAIHLHNSGSSLMPRQVHSAMLDCLQLELEFGGYEAEAMVSEQIRNCYDQAAILLNCRADEIAFMENATAAWNAIFYGFIRNLGSSDKILTCQSEYASNYIAYLHARQLTGCQIVVVPDDETGQLDTDQLQALIDEHTRLISITHVPTGNGLVNPAIRIGAIAAKHGIPYLLDACQSAGQMPLDVEQLKCDALSCTGRKYLRGPRGTGLLYVRSESLEKFPPATVDLHGALWVKSHQYELASGARRYENFENNVAGQVGLGVAIEYANALGLDNIYQRIQALASSMREKLNDCAGITVHDQGAEQCGIVSFSHADIDAATIVRHMTSNDIHVGESTIYSTRLDFERRHLPTVVRSPVHYFNTEREIDTFISCLSAMR